MIEGRAKNSTAYFRQHIDEEITYRDYNMNKMTLKADLYDGIMYCRLRVEDIARLHHL